MFNNNYLLAVASAISTISAAKVSRTADGKCRALVLSGGSNNGAWETGVLWGLLHYGDKADFEWDVVTGVSAGALNTCMISTYATGEETEMTEFLSYTWANMHTDDVW